MRLNRQAVGAVVATAAMLVAGGAAVAGAANPKGEVRCGARILARIDAAEKTGRISPGRAATLRARVEGACSHPRARIAAFGMVKAAADFLGLDRAALRAQLPGTSLAGLAEKQGKSVAALEAAMVAPAKARLAQAVAAGRITQARADAIAKRLDALAERLAAKVFPAKQGRS